MTEAKDYRDTVFLPKTDFPMKAGLPAREPGILARWQAIGLEQRIRDSRSGREKFILHDGPPFANGDMHIGHALNHILKDMVVRTQTLLGKDAPYVPGWDCHGLPIEWKVEEEYRKKKRNKDDVPLNEFRAECRAYAQHWVDRQREQLKRLGIGGNWDKPYLTMDPEAEAVIVAELCKFAESGQLYRGAKPVMWSPVEKTALAEAEVEYEEITSTQIDVAFEIVEAPNCPAIQELIDEGETVHAVIWTTTPWTIPVNQAIAYGPEIIYLLFEQQGGPFDGMHFLIADDLQNDVLDRAGIGIEAEEVDDDEHIDDIKAREPFQALIKGSELAGAIARHPMAKLFSGEGRSPDGDDTAPDPQNPGFRRGTGNPDSSTAVARHPMARHFSPSPLAGEGGPQGRERGRVASATQETAEGAVESSGAQTRADPSPQPSPARGEGAMAEFFTRPRPFLPGDFVTTDQGTGLVHMAPDHGEDDFELCRTLGKAHGIEPVFAVEGDGRYRADWAWLGGQGSVINPKFNAPDGPICSDLRAAGALLAASADYSHSYPHSWRSKAKLIFRCTPQWFIAMDKELPSRLREGLGEGPPLPPPASGRGSLRQIALEEIRRVRFVPDKGRNRIGSMVEGRPDWVISRQRAWGVPITLFVDRRSGQYLADPAVNARIVAAVREGGIDAWSDDNAQALLGEAYNAADYERVTDILDVWFDSGSTHAFVLESGKWPELRWPADLYLEGSDQHRGWFQSSLLQSCGTRGRAPYDAVLTHGFTMDQTGKKMSKSLGNTVDPLKVMEDYGADIIRLWALSVDFTEDHRIGKEILAGTADQYRKLRNTFRYLLGALDGFSKDERVDDVEEMPELERYVLSLLAELDGKLRQAVADYDFNSYTRLLAEFCNNDLSAFYFDIRKDALYCDVGPMQPLGTDKRRACRSVLDTLFHALIRYAAPVLVFTAEEVWATRYPDAGSVHLLEWPVLPAVLWPQPDPGRGFSPGSESKGSLAPDQVRGDDFARKWSRLRELRARALAPIEQMRREKTVGSSLEAVVAMRSKAAQDVDWVASVDFAELCIAAEVTLTGFTDDEVPEVVDVVAASPTTHAKCPRCWRHLPEVAEDHPLCNRCTEMVDG